MSSRLSRVLTLTRCRPLSLEPLEIRRLLYAEAQLPQVPLPEIVAEHGLASSLLSEHDFGRNLSSGAARRNGFDTSVLNVPWAAEKESVSGGTSNDTVATAQHLRNFGTQPGNVSEVNILGSLGITAREIYTREDDGSIRNANATGLRAGQVGSILARAKIGDGPHDSAGSGTGDYDFYKLSAQANQLVSVNVESDSLYLRNWFPTEIPKNTIAALYDSAGNLLTYNDDLSYLGTGLRAYGLADSSKGHFDPGFSYLVPADGDYYVVVFSSFE